MSTSMTLNDLKPKSFGEFFAISGWTHISSVNGAEMARDRPKQLTFEIFAIECRL